MENRKHRRKDVKLSIELKTDQDVVQAYTANLSLGGIFVRTDTRPALHSEVSLRMRLPNGEVLETAARVVHVVEDSETGGVGLEFVGSDEMMVHLQRYLDLL